MTPLQLDALIESFDGTPADLARIAANPVSYDWQLVRLFEGIESEAEAQALVAANPRFAAQLAEGQATYNEMLAFTDRCAAIEAASDPAQQAALIAALSPSDRSAFVAATMAIEPGADEYEAAMGYLAMVQEP
jgi:hypothetical protein